MHQFANFMGTHALALKEKQINNEGPCYVHLAGRKSGLIDWILNLFGIDTTTKLDVYADHIEFSYHSISGHVLEIIPFTKVSNLNCGQLKPTILFFMAMIAACAAYPTYGLSLILSIIFIIYYFLKKTVFISIIPDSASVTSIAFKRSVIENKNLSEEEAKQIIDIIAYLVKYANQK